MDQTGIEIISEMQQRFGSANWQNWSAVRTPQWDYVRLATAGVNSVSFFVNPLGSQDPVAAQAKTLEDTNLGQGGTFGQVYFCITQVRTHVLVLPKSRQPAGIKDQSTTMVALMSEMMPAVKNLMGNGVLRIFIGQKEYITPINRPFVSCPPGFGLDVYQVAGVYSAAAPYNILMQQDNDDANVLGITPYQWVEPSQTIQARIDFPQYNSPVWSSFQVNSTTPWVNIGLIFDGYVIRPSQ